MMLENIRRAASFGAGRSNSRRLLAPDAHKGAAEETISP